VTAVVAADGIPHAISPAISEPPPFTPGMGGIMRTTDVDRLHDLAPGWVEQSFQLGRGQFEGSLSFGQTGRMQFAVKDWRPGLLVRGSAPEGTAVLGFPLVDSAAGRLRGLSLASTDFGYISRSEEVDFRSTTPYRVFLIAMREEELEAYAEIVLGDRFGRSCAATGSTAGAVSRNDSARSSASASMPSTGPRTS